MAYEYEKNVVAEIKELGARYKAPSFYAMADEVEEVYAKARAWDKYLESTVRQEAIDRFGEGDPRVDYAVELTERLYREDK